MKSLKKILLCERCHTVAGPTKKNVQCPLCGQPRLETTVAHADWEVRKRAKERHEAKHGT